MSLVTRSTNASIDPIAAQHLPTVSGLYAGADLDVAAPCYIKSDGKVYMADGSASAAAASVHGFTPRAVKSGQPVTLLGAGTRFKYADSGLTPGAVLYLGATAGRLDTAASTGDSVGVAFAIDATHIQVTRADGKHS